MKVEGRNSVYELLKTDKALKLSNMIFPHKQDQINFMHQYLGK